MEENLMKVTIIKKPTKRDLQWVKTCTLNTVGKTSTSAPTEEWLHRLAAAEHSPIRELWFGFKMEIPYWVSVHFVRHNIGANHYVQSQRDDRTYSSVSRNFKQQSAPVSHVMSINAQELIHLAHKRLCKQASPETREVMQLIVKEVSKVAPYLAPLLVPLCVYRNGKCTEMFSCKAD
jgi:hypothetical protein